MPNQFGQVEIVDGPSRFAYFLSLMERVNRPVTFHFNEFYNGSWEMPVQISEIVREDGSGNSWMYKGDTNGVQVCGLYRTNEHRGFVSHEIKSFIPAKHPVAYSLLYGPGIEDLFRSMTDGNWQSRLTCEFSLNSPMLGYKRWNVTVDGIGLSSESPYMWNIYMALKCPVDRADYQPHTRVVGKYSTKFRTGQLYFCA